MGSGECDAIDDGGGGKSLSSSCSICLEIVTDNGDRSWAKLQCGHEFHLDCIGSAFNIKGAMQCPNCRKIEKGQWLYASSCNSFSDILDDLPHDDDYYEIFGVQWCPLPALSRLPSFEEGDFPSTTYHDFLGQHTVLAEHTVVSSTHQCPYVAYYGPVHSSSAGSVSNGSNYNNCWAGPGPSEMHTSHAFGAMDPNYHGLEHPSLNLSASGSRLGASEPSSQINYDLPRSGSFVHTYLPNHSYNDRVGSSVTSSMVPPYQGSAARTRERVQALQAYFEPVSSSPPMHSPTMSNTRRPNNHRTLAQGAHLPSSSAQTGYIVYPRAFPEAENPPLSSRFHEWERDRLSLHPVTQAYRDSSWLEFLSTTYGSERFPSQNW